MGSHWSKFGDEDDGKVRIYPHTTWFTKGRHYFPYEYSSSLAGKLSPEEYKGAIDALNDAAAEIGEPMCCRFVFSPEHPRFSGAVVVLNIKFHPRGVQWVYHDGADTRGEPECLDIVWNPRICEHPPLGFSNDPSLSVRNIRFAENTADHMAAFATSMPYNQDVNRSPPSIATGRPVMIQVAPAPSAGGSP